MNNIDISKITHNAAELAKHWQEEANRQLTPAEKKVQKKMAGLLTHPTDKVLLTMMFDQSFRTLDKPRVADQVNQLLRECGIPNFLSPPEKGLFHLFMHIGRHLPVLSVPAIVGQIRKDSRRTIVPGEEKPFLAHLAKRKAEGVRMNINHIGEAVLGEEEAGGRLRGYLADLENPAIEQISIKISTIYSQIQPLAFDQTIDELVKRLTKVYRAARDHEFIKADGTAKPKFVNLDMEEYRDLDLTAAAFMKALDKDELKEVEAGIVLQAYVPDSFNKMKELTAWAKKRVAAGGAPMNIRIVKGANMEMEQVESSLMNWPLAPYDNKREVDANYKRMVLFGMQPENIVAVSLGIASHNLFEQAFASTVAKHYGVTDRLTYELLEGMGDHVRRAIQQSGGNVLLYAPVAEKDQFINAIAYLIRRLDENTSEENFLRYACDLSTDSEKWAFLHRQYLDAVASIDEARTEPTRTQNRATETFPSEMGTFHEGNFTNEPDTDWSRPGNRAWAEAVREKWMNMANDAPLQVPAVIDGEELFEGCKTRDSFDPNRESEKIRAYRFAMASIEQAERAIDVAVADPDGWRSKSYEERNAILSKVAMELRTGRGDLVGAAALDTGKVFSEADVEISEAIDFAEYYPFSAQAFDNLENVEAKPEGVGLVISPWNFPIAIPCGGVLSMLAAGNTVIFKPASDSVMVAHELCKCIWKAGVSKKVLQFVPCSGASVGPTLTMHPSVNSVILTGSTETGMEMLKVRPNIQLAAETGGKNATIVSAMSDHDQAIANIVQSAFSNCGQKCSATSIAILDKELYHDKHFRRQLVDAARSLAVGSAWDFKNKLATLIKPPSGDLLRGLTELEPGEEWALKPECVDGNPYIWSPGIKWGVTRGSYTHMTEFFGPVLGVICSDHLDEAIEMANQPGYGLTSGLESLDQREQETWKSRILAGNLYINRGTTGAVVLRQPFGGMRKSAIGAGIKAGGPNYVTQFMELSDTALPPQGVVSKDHRLMRVVQDWQSKVQWGSLAEHAEDLTKAARATLSYLHHYEQEFGVEKDYFHLRGQDNVVRYLPIGKVAVRVHANDSLFETLARCTAVLASRCSLVLSIPEGLDNAVTRFLSSKECSFLLKGSEVVVEDNDAVAARMGSVQGIRYAAADRVPGVVYDRAAELGFYIARKPVMMEGRIELLQYFHEQAVSITYHRYGNLAARALA
jgi:RHH-type proline utilization regulon transcriptional repressor/proline dehydrogenase/delta 1-pyrroline-5-carboxylate dehydrogenase